MSEPDDMQLAPGFDEPEHRAWVSALPRGADAVPDEAIIYQARNRLYRADCGERQVVVKEFRPRGRFHRLLYRWRSSKARRSYDNARRLQELGIDTPEPLAWAEWRCGRRLELACFCCAWLPDACELRSCHDPERQDRLQRLQEAGSAIAALHEAGAEHRDLTAGNILLVADGRGWRYPVVDLNRMRFRRVSLRRGLKALAMLEFTDDARAALVEGYCQGRGAADLTRARATYDRALTHHLLRMARKKLLRRLRRR